MAMASAGNGNGDTTTSSPEMIKPGTLLLKCDPLVYVGHLQPPILCDTCLVLEAAAGYKMKRCSFCQVVYYCNAECQKKGWVEGHKYECKRMTAVLVCIPMSKQLAWMPRMLLRLILKLQDGKDYYDELEIGGTKIQRRFEDLWSKLDCEESRRCKDGKIALDLMIYCVKHMLRDKPKIKVPNDDQLHKMCGKILGSVMEITNNWYYRVGCGVYLGRSFFGHSCKSNTVPTFEGKTMSVRNTMEIPKSLPVDKLTISYLYNNLMPTEERRKILNDKWYFHCECEMCQTGEMDKELRGLICPSKGCSAEIDSKEMRKPCSSCGRVMGKEVISKVLEAEQFARKLLKAGNFELEAIEDCIKKLRKAHYSDKHWLMLRLFDEGMTKATSLAKETQKVEYWKKTYEYGSKYLAVARRFFHPNEVELVRFLLDLGASSFAVSEYEFEEADKHLTEAKAIAEVVYGKDSSFIKTRIDEEIGTLNQAKMIFKMQKLGVNAERNAKA